MPSHININDVFRSKQAIIEFGTLIDPIVNDRVADRSTRKLYGNFYDLIGRRLKPQTISLIFQIMDNNGQKAFMAAYNVMLAIIKWGLASGTTTKQFLQNFVESYWQMPENASSSFAKRYAVMLEQCHGIETQLPIPFPGLVHFYQAAFLQHDQDALRLVDDIDQICIENFSLLYPNIAVGMDKIDDAGFTIKSWLCPDFDLAKVILQHHIARLDKQKQQSDKTREVFGMIQANAQTVEDFLVACWDDIANRPRRDVLPNGGDVIEVSGFLRLTGTQRIQFVREGYAFPRVGIRNFYRSPNGRQRSFMAVLEPGYGTTAGTALQLYRLPEFLFNTYCYHQIVCAPPRSSGNGGTRPKPIVVTTDRERQAVQVRAHFRRLVEGHNPSKEQERKATETFGRLPDGYTFVSLHHRGKPTAHVPQPTSDSRPPVVNFDDILRVVIGS